MQATTNGQERTKKARITYSSLKEKTVDRWVVAKQMINSITPHKKQALGLVKSYPTVFNTWKFDKQIKS